MVKVVDVEEKHKALIDISFKYMKSIKDREHDLGHMLDVVEYTKELLEKVDVDVDYEVCVIAAYFHDVGRIKTDVGHEEESALILRNEMMKLGYDADFINGCSLAVEKHKWNMRPTTMEGLIVKDADKLAFLGFSRWNNFLKYNYKLYDIMRLLPKLRNDILYFDESRKIYDREIVKLVTLLYEECCNKK